MEARYVHTPAVAPEHRSEEDSVPPDTDAESGMQDLVARVEARVRAHPGYFVAGGFAVGLLLGILARR